MYTSLEQFQQEKVKDFDALLETFDINKLEPTEGQQVVESSCKSLLRQAIRECAEATWDAATRAEYKGESIEERKDAWLAPQETNWTTI